MTTKRVQHAWLGMACLVFGLVMNLVGAQEQPAGVQQGVRLVETRADDHSDTNEPPRDKRFFAFSGFNGPQPFQPTVPFEALANYVQQQDQFGGRTGSRNFAPDVIDTRANNHRFNTFNQMMSSPQFGGFNGRTGNRPQGNMWPWGYSGDWSQWGWPYGGGFGGRSYGAWNQNYWGQYGQNGQWNQFGGRSVSGPWSQFGGRSGRRGGYWPTYGSGYGYGYPYGIGR